MDQYTIKVLCRKEWEAGVQHGIACEQQRITKLIKSGKWVGETLSEDITKLITLIGDKSND